jgi:hypothetical protein
MKTTYNVDIGNDLGVIGGMMTAIAIVAIVTAIIVVMCI